MASRKPISEVERYRKRMATLAKSGPRRDIERFWKYANSDAPNERGCWIWSGTEWGTSGYGRGNYAKKPEGAHRISWLIHFGAIPGGRFVCHRCDTPKCVNPAHLFLGTIADNHADMVSKRRHPHGDSSPRRRHSQSYAIGSKCSWSKLNEDSARAIRKAFTEGATQQALATRYGVSRSAIWQISTMRW